MRNSNKLLVCIMLTILAANNFAETTPYTNFPVNIGLTDEIDYTPLQTTFQLWAPMAEAVEVRLYENGETGFAQKVQPLVKLAKGTWKAVVSENQKGKFYTFRIKQNGQWLKETPGIRAKAVGVNGNRAAIVDLKETNPAGWQNDSRPALKNYSDIVIYEMHHRDFSIATNSGMKHKGKFAALTETGTKNSFGQATGIDHLKELGITHLHLLPSYDFGSVDETKLNQPQYNWGYDPKNYNVPEGSYSTNPYNPTTRIREFKQMVQSIHRNGLRVILDVVYNHTYANDDSNFSLTAPGYFYRHNADGSYSNASGCLNETASERAMMRQFMVESVKYWATEYHVDGFRFDLMGIHDIETMNQIRKALDKIDPTIFIYGEGWMAGGSPLPEKEQAIKRNGLRLPRIAVFSDDLRDAVKGSWNNEKSGGFVAGVPDLEESIKFGVVGATLHPQVDYAKVNYSKEPYANNPSEVINYVSCHDDMCLNDKLKISANPSDTEKTLISRNKLAQTIVFTSQGVPFLLAGEELYRTKKGVHNSFQSPDSINEINWDNKSTHADIFHYYQKLIELRKTHPAFRMNKTEDVVKNLKFIPVKSKNSVGFTLSNHANGDAWKQIVVVYNGNSTSVEVNIPSGNWNVVALDGKIDLKGITRTIGETITVPSISAFIAYQ